MNESNRTKNSDKPFTGSRGIAQGAPADSIAAFPLLPERYWCEGTEGSTWDPVVLRARAEAHRGHRFDHKMDGVNAGLLLYLLDVWEAAKDAADWHEGKSGHITDRNLVDAVRGIER